MLSNGPTPDGAPHGALGLPESVLAAPQDEDGFPIPTAWQNSAKWPTIAYEVRAKWSAIWIEDEKAKEVKARMEKPKPPKRGTPATRFTTDYAIEWGRSQKKASGLNWTLVDREHYDYRTRRHHDLQGGVDALFDDGGPGLVGVQGAGLSERKVHFERFMAWGGPEKARRRALKIYYLEFERGKKTPVKVERWDTIGMDDTPSKEIKI